MLGNCNNYIMEFAISDILKWWQMKTKSENKGEADYEYQIYVDDKIV